MTAIADVTSTPFNVNDCASSLVTSTASTIATYGGDVVQTSSLCYIPTLDEIWIVMVDTDEFFEDSINYIVRYAPTGAVIGTIVLPVSSAHAALNAPLGYDPVGNLVWVLAQGRLYKVNVPTATYLAETDTTGYVSLWVSPYTGYVYSFTNDSPTYTLKRINPDTGALISSYVLGQYIYDVTFDDNNNAWSTSSTTKNLIQINLTTAAVTSHAITAAANSLYFATFDVDRDSLWIKDGAGTGEVIEVDATAFTITQTLSVFSVSSVGIGAKPVYYSSVDAPAVKLTVLSNITTDKVYVVCTDTGLSAMSVDVTNPDHCVLDGTAVYTSSSGTLKKITLF